MTTSDHSSYCFLIFAFNPRDLYYRWHQKRGQVLDVSWHSYIAAASLAFVSHGPQNASAISFIKELGNRTSQRSGDARETQFLFQWLCDFAEIQCCSFWPELFG